MTTEDRQAAERRLAAWLDESAPKPPTDLAGRLLAHTATLPQRARGGVMDMFVIRAAGVAAVIATAVVIGLSISSVIGPQPPVGTSSPSASASAPASASVEPSPSEDASPTSAEATHSAPAGPGRIAFMANRSNETSGIYLMNADGSNVVELIDDPAVHEMDPIWSPDGSTIAYHTMSAGSSIQGGVYIIDADGGEPVLVDDNYAYGASAWSPDGSMLVVGGDGTARGVSVYHVAEDRLEPLTDDGGTAPTWSPDGSRIAYNVAGGPTRDIRVVDVASGEIHNVTDDPWNDSVGRWTEDGTRLVFSSDRETDQTKPSFSTWIVDAGSGGEPELLGDGQLLAFAYWPSPDGEWLAYAAPDDSLRLSRADGSEDRAVHPDYPADLGASWAPDSSGFVFSNAADAGRDIFVMRVDAEAPEQLTDHEADESSPNWGPSGR
jgi:Tol biopolymer transport system component